MTNIFELNKKAVEPAEQSKLRTVFSDPGLTELFKTYNVDAKTFESNRPAHHTSEDINPEIMVDAARKIV